MTIPNGDEWLTVQDAAKLSGYHAEYVRLLIRQGKLTARKFGPVWAISKYSLLAYLDIYFVHLNVCLAGDEKVDI